jgi:LmbE family N-acetylglucosaminyl deacetylase
MYGHPDHIAISQLTTTAVMAAADPHYPGLTTDSPHRVAKLYYRAFVQAEQVAYEATFGRLVMPVDRIERRFTVWPEWAITTRIDTLAYREKIWQAIECHRSQLPDHQKLKTLSAAYQPRLWGRQGYYRAMSLVNGGRAVEDDLFAGLRGCAQSQPLFYVAPQSVAV